MSDREDIADFDALRDEARAWVARIQSGEASTADTAALMRWRAQSPDHVRALGEAVRLRRLMVDAGRAARAADGRSVTDAPGGASLADTIDEPSNVVDIRAPLPASTRHLAGRRAFLGSAIAAAGGGFMIVRPPAGLWPSLAELRADYRTGTGEQRTLTLAKGVSVDMNTRTSLALRSSARQDALELIAGEVLVNVADAAKPVAIRTAAGVATARRSSRFGVRLQDDGTCVTCSAGTVSVRTAKGHEVELASNQQVTFGSDVVGPVARTDALRVEAWRTGRLIFVDEPLGKVVDELNRYRPGKIILANADLKDRPINAVFQLARLDNAVVQIREVARAKATELPGGIVFLS